MGDTQKDQERLAHHTAPVVACGKRKDGTKTNAARSKYELPN
jgi:hypothetical protein